ncbi:MAG: DUF6851 domain-containing protein [Pseudomonadota bacterium]
MEEYEQSVVAVWNELMLTAIRAGGAKPTETTYQLFVTSTAIYDAWAAYDDDAYGYATDIVRPRAEHTEENKIEAVSYAAYRTLSEFFPNSQAIFDDYMAELGFDTADTSTDPSTPAGVGNLASDGAFASRVGDGSNAENGFADTTGYEPVNSADPNADNAPGGDTFDPNSWQPLRVPNGTAVDGNGTPVATDDPSTYDDQIALTPQWGGVTPFALPSADAARPEAPPQLGDTGTYTDALGNVTTGDQAYQDQFTEVLEISAGLTVEQKVIAEVWADGPRTESPPGHWNQLTQDISKREGYGIDDDAKLFFMLNAAIFDAGIATWEAKYFYDYIRPQSAIRDLYFDQNVDAWAGPNLGTQTILGQEWQPYQNTTFVTPPFPEFTSGHSGFSRAAAEVIIAYTGSEDFYDGVSIGNYDLDGDGNLDLLGELTVNDLSFEDYSGPPIVLQWDTVIDAADEAGISRLYGGIHIQDGDLRGRALGQDVAEFAVARAEAHFTRAGNDVVISSLDGGIEVAGTGNDRMFGRGATDSLEGGAGNDRMIGRAGDDSLMGEAGRDALLGGIGGDSLYGGDDNDRLWGQTGDDILAGDAGNDALRAGGGDDSLVGGAGNDRLFGNAGSDLLHGGDGIDALFGGSGGDNFQFNVADTEFDVVADFDARVDMLTLEGFGVEFSDLNLFQIGARTAVRFDGDLIAVVKAGDTQPLEEDNFAFL